MQLSVLNKLTLFNYMQLLCFSLVYYVVSMINSFLWAALAAASLLIGAIFALSFKMSNKVIGLIMAFGVGVLVSAISFELVDEAFNSTHNLRLVFAGLVAGSLVYSCLDWLATKRGGRQHKKGKVALNSSNNGVSILLGTILDGIPESIIIGLSLTTGTKVSYAMVVAVFLSNIPEAISSTVGLKKNSWKNYWIIGLWASVVLVSGFAAVFGYIILSDTSSSYHAVILTFSAGALLTMVANNMMPEAYKDSGKFVGLVTTLGFGIAYLISVHG